MNTTERNNQHLQLLLLVANCTLCNCVVIPFNIILKLYLVLYIIIESSYMLVCLVLSQVKIVESIALGYLDNLTTFDTLTGKG